MQTKKIDHIQKLRALSILLVLLFHLEIPAFEYGYFGVDIFFVISGYLMCLLYGDMKSASDYRQFFSKRANRILPAYFCVLVATIFAASFMFLPHELRSVIEQGIWSAALVPNFGYWNSAPYFNYLELRPLLNFWSLGLELQFYLVFPLLLVVRRESANYLVALAALSFLIAAATTPIDPSTSFFMLPARLWEFLAGYYAAKTLANQKFSPNFFGPLAVLLVLLIIFTLPIFNLRNVFIPSVAIVSLTAIAIRFGFNTGTENGFVSKTLIEIGRYSYSIYLVHFPIIAFANYVPFEGNNLAVGSMSKGILVLAAIGLCAFSLHQIVEQRGPKSFLLKQVALFSIIFILILNFSKTPLVDFRRQNLLPAQLAITNALDDRGNIQCSGSLDVFTATGSSCRMNEIEDSKMMVILAGNSHADMIKEALANTLSRFSISLRLVEGYRSVGEISNGDPFLEEAAKQGAKTVLLHQTRQSDNGVAIVEFVRKAQELDISIIYISSVPIYQFSIPQRLYSDYQIEGAPPRSYMTAEEHYAKESELIERLNQLENEFGNFRWYDPAGYFCNETCSVAAEDHTPYYYDTNHLTLTGARMLTPLFVEIAENLD